MQKPLASIIMFTFNHARYIEQAMESCLSQQTDFPFELIIADDASTDGTQEIIRDWAARHPNIVVSQQAVNSKMSKNFLEGFGRVRSKYLAFCEGDDFWTTPYKLQKQVDFLEANPDFSVCCHKVEMLHHDPDAVRKHFVYKDCSADEERIQQGIFYADEAIANYYFQTGSFVLRWRFPDGLPSWFRQRMLFDHFIFMLHAVEGKIKYFDEVMSVWRRHESGYTWLQNIDKGLFFQKEFRDWILLYENMDRFFSQRFHLQIRERILLALRNLVHNCLVTKQTDQIERLVSEYQRFFAPVMENAEMVDAVRLVRPEKRIFQPPWSADHSAGALQGPCIDPSSETDGTAAEPKAMGGFLELGMEDLPETPGSVWEEWTRGHETACFANGKSALFNALWKNGITDVWLPAYMPPLVSKCQQELQVKRKIYGVNPDLTPSMDFLQAIQPGDAVVTIDYFGRPSPQALREQLAARDDILWIEDRAQALRPGGDMLADMVIYSPRYLTGVPDGGIVVGKNLDGLAPAPGPDHVGDILKNCEPLLRRYESGTVTQDELLAYQARCREFVLPNAPCSRLTLAMLRRTPLTPLAEARQRNWKSLYSKLSGYALWAIPEPDFAPYCFPLLLPDKSMTSICNTLLAERNIHCSRHWYQLNLPPRLFPAAENLSERLLSLPLDQRYTTRDMDTLAEEVLAILGKYA